MSERAALEELARSLRLKTSASRVTIRLRLGEAFPVVAESCGDGVASLRGVDVDPRAGTTFAFLVGERRLLVQEDVLAHELSPPPEAVSTYGIRSQMVAPVAAGDEIDAIVSVHDVKGPRAWTVAEQLALERAGARVGRLLLARAARGEIAEDGSSS
jgi:GAF domain-containing protein